MRSRGGRGLGRSGWVRRGGVQRRASVDPGLRLWLIRRRPARSGRRSVVRRLGSHEFHSDDAGLVLDPDLQPLLVAAHVEHHLVVAAAAGAGSGALGKQATRESRSVDTGLAPENSNRPVSREAAPPARPEQVSRRAWSRAIRPLRHMEPASLRPHKRYHRFRGPCQPSQAPASITPADNHRPHCPAHIVSSTCRRSPCHSSR